MKDKRAKEKQKKDTEEEAWKKKKEQVDMDSIFYLSRLHLKFLGCKKLNPMSQSPSR